MNEESPVPIPHSRFLDLSHILNHLGEEREGYHGAVSPPLVQSSIFAFPTVAAMREAFRDEYAAHLYTRGNNPTVSILRKKLAALEGAEDCLVFASGAAAMAAGISTFVRAGEHIVCVARPYSWTRGLLRDLLPRFGVATSFVDGGEVAGFEAALTPSTRLIVLESPNSMTFEQQDLAGIAALARRHGILTLCDNSHATPLNQSPLALGIDLVAHSATKYLNGHSDVIAGALVTKAQDDFWARIAAIRAQIGGVLGPFEAWLLLRGMRTLYPRVHAASRAALAIAEHCARHPGIAGVMYPGLPSDPGHALAKKQMPGGFGGMLSIRIKGGEAAAIAMAANLKIWKRATSLGGVESLVEHRASVEGAGSPAPPDLLRLSVGLEHVDDLVGDIDAALAAAAKN
ncbi:MAG: aminotransferase class I/II-fold pyridoxal phosphate-dependent enzyme [Dokdonella sp.]|nr:aminotransferase class I/II-fold pyridoxal phosphate-dependent enzyme [Dokdonella sp.]